MADRRVRVNFSGSAQAAASADRAMLSLCDAAALAADATEEFAHEMFHKLDGPGDQPCSRCAALLEESRS